MKRSIEKILFYLFFGRLVRIFVTVQISPFSMKRRWFFRFENLCLLYERHKKNRGIRTLVTTGSHIERGVCELLRIFFSL